MSTPEAEEAAPPKSKKMLIIIVAAVLVLVLGGGGAWFFISKKHAAEAEDGEEEQPAAVAEASGPPTYMPLDNMVVNLADPGGERVAQIGITLELSDEHEADAVKKFLPSIRNDILLLISQRTADELLTREGKDKLAEDILAASGKHFGVNPEKAEKADKGAEKKKKKDKEKGKGGSPVRGVLFSSFIVQ